MTTDIIVSVITGLLALVGLTGIIVPVLPGSMTIIVGLLIWAIFIGGPVGWTVFGVGALLCVVGMISTYVLTGRVMKRHQIPNRSVVIGLVCGVVGMFVIPVVGLVIGFVVGLFVSEYLRIRDSRKALQTSWQAIKAAAHGILVEFTCACLAIITFVIGLFLHF